MSDLIYRVRWQERYKPTCTCCTDLNHPWSERTDTDLTLEQAEKQERRVWDRAENGLEVKDVVVEVADAPTWSRL
jgi:hypothetical protein